MATVYKVLGQAKPGAATLTTLYTVPAATSVVASTITICNQSGTATAYRVSVRIAGAADTPAQYVAYDAPIAGNETQSYTIGITLAATDVVSVYNTLATCSFNLFGSQIT